jgi:hypothetical protein
MPDNSIRQLLCLAITALIIETPLVQTTFAAETVSLFKVVTTRDEIVIGLNDGELAQLDSMDAGGVAKLLVGKGSISVWQYAVRKNATGGSRRRCARSRSSPTIPCASSLSRRRSKSFRSKTPQNKHAVIAPGQTACRLDAGRVDTAALAPSPPERGLTFRKGSGSPVCSNAGRAIVQDSTRGRG